ncbi:MAG: VWA domain-containing protein [Candidatus Dependentiae bacterium]|nr:VWA domain-containing protein [Candidatus Dependentiae bacterium]
MVLSGITWGALENIFIVGALILLTMLLLGYRVYRSKKSVAQLSSSRIARQFLVGFSLVKLYVKSFLFVLGMVFLLITLLHPQWNKKEEIVAQHGRDLFIALDVSRSMLAQDCLPNRLECAKAKIKSLVKKLSCERVGLVIFSGTAFIQCPLTTDYGAFFMFLDQVDVETIASGTTALDQVIQKVLGAYTTMQDRKTKLLMLLTDGEDFSSNLQRVRQRAQEQGLKIFAMGVGTEQGAPIPLVDNHGKQIGHIKDKKGSVVISHLNEGILYNVAQDSGGTYVRMTSDDADIKSIIAHVNSFEKDLLEDKRMSALQEQYHCFLVVSFVCFLLEWLW